MFTLNQFIEICTKLRNGEDVILHEKSQKTAKADINALYDLLNWNKQYIAFINAGIEHKNFVNFNQELHDWLRVSDEPNEESAKKCQELYNIITKDNILLNAFGSVDRHGFSLASIDYWAPSSEEIANKYASKERMDEWRQYIIDTLGKDTYYFRFQTMLIFCKENGHWSMPDKVGWIYVTFDNKTHTPKRNTVDMLIETVKVYAKEVAHVINPDTIVDPTAYDKHNSTYATMLKVFNDGIELVRNGGDPYDGGGLRYCSDKQAYVMSKFLNVPIEKAAKLNRYQVNEIFMIKNNTYTCQDLFGMSQEEAFDFYRDYLKNY